MYRSLLRVNIGRHFFINKQSKRFKTYLPSNEWLSNTNNNTIKIGIDNKASELLGDLVYIEFMVEKGDIIEKDEELVTLESVKAVANIKAPFDCVIKDLNLELENNLDFLNSEPECEINSWFFELLKK